jgi:hypothetical protein
MSNLTYVKPTLINLKGHPQYNEMWVHERIAEDPAILGLGDIVVKDRERIHKGAGRLDLLCQDQEANRRYEIEIQLGKCDETHIIRTIEYWDIERRRYPQYDHTAVIIAEDITSRFLNVISLFNGSIPLIAVQMQALQVGNAMSLVFTQVLNEVRLGLVDEDEESFEVTDRAYWEKRASRASLEVMDTLAVWATEIEPALTPKYNKFYIGLATHTGQPNNYVIFRPRKGSVRVEPRLDPSDELQALLDGSGLNVMDYDTRWGRYRINVTNEDIPKQRDVIMELMRRAFEAAQ